ncbi:YARHG domain-containing protein [Leptospira terpstrae]|uniref:YARHG domain protein n=1 Tax=Leptospira terpstrae serovar Hualin str. LT 11-33 = ATCC 700639 TaxID=1257025 RepID=N1VXP8_9LEPT|nr:YARHG domain-containing protein [Leptospira terpstrae]EMY61820.1 YARHG domain protein [Leptospira terpstrae serovar Hualin str. LT 11-33 = ATCC 700639]
MENKKLHLIISIIFTINCCFLKNKVEKIIDVIIDNKKISKEDIQSIEKIDELRLLRNAVFARHGRTFNDKKLQNFFEKYSWYKPKKDIKIILSNTDEIILNLIRNSESSILIKQFLNKPKKNNLKNMEITLIGDWDTQPVSSSGYVNKHTFLENGLVQIYEDEMDCQKRLLSSFGTWRIENDTLFINLSKKLVINGGKLIPSAGSCGSEYELVDGYNAFEDLNPVQNIEYKIKEITSSPFAESSENKSLIKTDKIDFYRLPK